MQPYGGLRVRGCRWLWQACSVQACYVVLRIRAFGSPCWCLAHYELKNVGVLSQSLWIIIHARHPARWCKNYHEDSLHILNMCRWCRWRAGLPLQIAEWLMQHIAENLQWNLPPACYLDFRVACKFHVFVLTLTYWIELAVAKHQYSLSNYTTYAMSQKDKNRNAD